MLNEIETRVLEMLLEHEASVELAPGTSLDDLELVSRNWTGAGFMTEFGDSPVVGPARFDGPASPIGYGFRGRLNDEVDFGVLPYFEEGRLTALECFSYGEAWPEEVFVVTYSWAPLWEAAVVIKAAGLWTGAHEDKQPLSSLDDDEHSHIHGCLSISVGGYTLPHLGYRGPDDVCFNDWVEQLMLIRDGLASDGGEHVFDESEQGQPAFAFVRDRDVVKVSIRASEISDGPADPAWDEVPFKAEAFLGAVDECLRSLETEISAVGEVGERWWRARQRVMGTK